MRNYYLLPIGENGSIEFTCNHQVLNGFKAVLQNCETFTPEVKEDFKDFKKFVGQAIDGGYLNESNEYWNPVQEIFSLIEDRHDSIYN